MLKWLTAWQSSAVAKLIWFAQNGIQLKNYLFISSYIVGVYNICHIKNVEKKFIYYLKKKKGSSYFWRPNIVNLISFFAFCVKNTIFYYSANWVICVKFVFLKILPCPNLLNNSCNFLVCFQAMTSAFDILTKSSLFLLYDFIYVEHIIYIHTCDTYRDLIFWYLDWYWISRTTETLVFIYLITNIHIIV